MRDSPPPTPHRSARQATDCTKVVARRTCVSLERMAAWRVGGACRAGQASSLRGSPPPDTPSLRPQRRRRRRRSGGSRRASRRTRTAQSAARSQAPRTTARRRRRRHRREAPPTTTMTRPPTTTKPPPTMKPTVSRRRGRRGLRLRPRGGRQRWPPQLGRARRPPLRCTRHRWPGRRPPLWHARPPRRASRPQTRPGPGRGWRPRPAAPGSEWQAGSSKVR